MTPTLISKRITGRAFASVSEAVQFSLIATFTGPLVVDMTSTVNWASSNTLVATVSSTGLVTCVGLGNVVISESAAGDITRSIPFQVTVPGLANASAVLTKGASSSMGRNAAHVLWTDFALCGTLPSDAVITGMYPVLVASAVHTQCFQYFEAGHSLSFIPTGGFGGSAADLTGPSGSFASSVFSNSSFDTSLSALAAFGIGISLASSLPIGAFSPADVTTVTGVGVAIYYTSATPTTDTSLPAPGPVPSGHGVIWALPLTVSSDGLDSAGVTISATASVTTLVVGPTYVAPPSSLIRLRVQAPASYLHLGETKQLTALADYPDGTVVDVTSLSHWSSTSMCMSVSDTGLATAIRMLNPQTNGGRHVSIPTAVATYLGQTGTLAIPFSFNETSAETEVLPWYRSHRTQVMLNYFDITDQRVREEPYTLDAQLLNIAAIALDDSQQRLAREVASRFLSRCPSGIDNRGLYYKVSLPNTLSLNPGQTLLSQVSGTLGADEISVQPYDDRLPVPASYSVDESVAPVAMTNPVLVDTTGTGDSSNQIWDPQVFGPFTMPIPNTLTFWVEGVQGSRMALTVFVQGKEYPLPVWADQQEGASEVLTASNEGHFVGTKIWQNITSITVRGLPAGVRLRCWQMPFNVPAVPDPSRPFTHSVFRDVLFDRYWQVSSSDALLKETYMMDNYSTLEYVQSYSMPLALGALAVEPNTWGILGASGTTLIYWDRREPMPDQLTAPASTVEPLYGLDVRYEISNPGTTRYVTLRPVPYGSATNMTTWRYVSTDPTGNLQVIQSDGSAIDYSGGAGWQQGKPTPVTIPLEATGTWVFILECADGNRNVTADEVPYPNLAVPVTNQYDLSGLVPAIEGIAYDFLGQLWVWTGSTAIALKPRYDGYILDSVGRNLYLTDRYDSVLFE